MVAVQQPQIQLSPLEGMSSLPQNRASELFLILAWLLEAEDV